MKKKFGWNKFRTDLAIKETDPNVPTESRPCCDCLIVLESDGALNQEHKEGCEVGKLYKAFRAACYWVWRMTDEPGMTVDKMMGKFMNGEIKEEPQ